MHLSVRETSILLTLHSDLFFPFGSLVKFLYSFEETIVQYRRAN